MKAHLAGSIRIALFVWCMLIALDRPADADEIDPPPSVSLAALAAERVPSAETTFLPSGDLFKLLLADPKEPRFYLSYRVVKYKAEDFHAFVGGYGDIFGLYRHYDSSGYSWQVNFGGGIHAQFDLDAYSFALVNTDYTIGFPVSVRNGNASYRFALYHQSSHLGDEYLLINHVDRLELSFEAIELIGSYEWPEWRIYGGGEYILHQGPTDIEPAMAHAGIEYYDAEARVGWGRLVGGWDLKSDQEHDWTLNSSIKIGIQFDGSRNNARYIRVLAEGYKGISPYGQFYLNASRMAYAGIGIYLGFE